MIRDTSTTALCLCGELRTLAMPLVRHNLRELAAILRADTFAATRNADNRRFATTMWPDRAAYVSSCTPEENAYALNDLSPIATHEWHQPNSAKPCPLEHHAKRWSDAQVQLSQIDACFGLVRVHEAKMGREYQTWVRARPDLLVLQPRAEIQPFATWRAGVPSGLQAWSGRADAFFGGGRAHMTKWLQLAHQQYAPNATTGHCPTNVDRWFYCCLEATFVWDWCNTTRFSIPGVGIARNSDRIDLWINAGRRRAPLLRRVNISAADQSQLKCEVSSRRSRVTRPPVPAAVPVPVPVPVLHP